MARWSIGTVVQTKDGSLAYAEAGRLGVIIAVHETTSGIGGRFAQTVTIRTRENTIICGTDELAATGKTLASVTDDEIWNARIAYGEWSARAARKARDAGVSTRWLRGA